MTLALGTRLTSTGSGSVTPVDPPVERRALVTEDLQPITLEFVVTDYIVISDGTFESIALEDGSTFLTQEDLGKLILTVN